MEQVIGTYLEPRQGLGGRSNQKVENEVYSTLRQLTSHEPR